MSETDYASAGIEEINRLSNEDFDKLNFGVVGLDLEGNTVVYNQPQAIKSAMSKNDCLGHNFFLDVAPCTNNFMVAERMLEEDNIDEEIPYVLTFKMKPTKVKMRLLKQDGIDRMFILMNWD